MHGRQLFSSLVIGNFHKNPYAQKAQIFPTYKVIDLMADGMTYLYVTAYVLIAVCT